MKKFFVVMFICFLLSCTTTYQPREEITFDPLIFSYKVSTTRISISGEKDIETTTEYLIYFGTKETAEQQSVNEQYGIMVKMTLLHPIPSVENSLVNSYNITKKDKHRWYVLFMNSIKKMMATGPLFECSVWQFVPQLIKHILIAFHKDTDLVVIIYDYATETTSLIFHPDFAEDKAYHEQKYNNLVKYLNSVEDFNAEINLSDF